MKSFKISLTTIILLSIFAFPTFGQEKRVADILGDQEINEDLISELDSKEEEREDDFENQLLLKIPEQTDNPSHILTFTDPSSNKSGVELEIDGTKYIKINSPYSLPALGIGEHVLKFRFTDKEGATQTLEKELTVLPRPPIINSPLVEDKKVVISGTGLANSELILLITQGSTNITKTLDIDKDGKWEYTHTPEQALSTLLNISAYTRKYGYASDPSEVTTFSSTSANSNSSQGEETSPLIFSIQALANPSQIVEDSPEFFIYSAGIFVIGFLFSIASTNVLRKYKERKHVKDFEKKINHNKPDSLDKTGQTLREKLAQENKSTEPVETKSKKEEKEDKKEAPKEEVEKKEKVISKQTFMKDFKNFDPDNSRGKEKRVKVSLTSKKEE